MSVRAAIAAVAAAVLGGCGSGAVATAPRILAVRVPAATMDAAGHATAFAVGDGRAVTVAHVLRAGHPVFVAGRRARVLRVDRRLDVAVLAVSGARAAALRIGAAHAGEPATVRVLRAGAMRSVPATVRRTISARVSGFGGPARVRPAVELAAAVMPGDSGAPVLDRGGRMLGVVFAEARDSEPLAYALDARALASVLTPDRRD